MVLRVFGIAAGAASLFLTAAPAAAQNGQPRPSVQFLNSVREEDGNKVNTYLQDQTNDINAKDPYGDGDGALHVIARKRNNAYLSVFLNQPRINANLQNRNGDSPLMVATEVGWIEGVRTLLDRKANVNLANDAGETPLIRAVLLHNSEMVELLLKAGADPDKADYRGGMTAREYAKRETRYPGIARVLAAAPKGGSGAAAVSAGPRL